MKGFSYQERDYAFGQTMLTVRTRIGLTQAELAKTLGVNRKTVGNWERGSGYPEAEHLKQFIVLAIQHHAFPPEAVAEEAHAIWQKAHQRVLFDEAWLAALLPQPEVPPSLQPVAVTGAATAAEASTAAEPAAAASLGHRVDWNNAMTVPVFYGREREIDLLTGWVIADRCRVVCVQGIGGIGKSALAVSLMHRVADHFQVVIWRSMRDLPTCEELLNGLLQVLHPQSLSGELTSRSRRQDILLEQMRNIHVLLVLDNFEAVLEEGDGAGKMRPGFEGLERILRLATETEHQSCVLLTSREKPAVLVPFESSQAPVRVLRLGQLDTPSCVRLLAEKGLRGSAPAWAQLIEAYTGNPLALKIAAQTIVDLFEGEIVLFLKQGEVIFGSVRDLLGEQFARLSRLGQTVLLWLAILREPCNLDELHAALVAPLPPDRLFEALESLYRRSLIERSQEQGSFTLQSVVMEFLTVWLIAQITAEIGEETPAYLIEQSIELASAKEYIRQTQERVIVIPILTRLRSEFPLPASLEEHLQEMLRRMVTLKEDEQGYGPANLVTLLRVLKGNLRGLDLSELMLRGAYLQGVEMQDATLSNATLHGVNFTETFETIGTLTISDSGQYWASNNGRGAIHVWEAVDERLNWMWQTPADGVQALEFSTDCRWLAIGGRDGMIQLWEVINGALLWSNYRTHNINKLTFSPDGKVLASAGNDSTARLWDTQRGTLLQVLPHPGPVFAVSWSPDGRWLASGDSQGTVRLWEVRWPDLTACILTLSGHTDWVRALSFSSDSRLLASGSYDGKVILWDIANGAIQQSLAGQTDRIQHIAWSPDGRLIASSGFDRVIWLWEVGQDHPRVVLQGHNAPINGLAFTSDSGSLLSGSDDGSLRAWDVERGQCARLFQGYLSTLFDLDWSPDGRQIITCGANAQITLWEVAKETPSKIWHDHYWVVYGVGWSPNGKLLASSGWEGVVRLWDLTSETQDEIREPNIFFNGLAWSPVGERLAVGTYFHSVLVYEVNTRTRKWMEGEYPTRFLRVAWSPDSLLLTSGGDDGYIYIWDTTSGRLLKRFVGHYGGVKSVAWSPDGARLASVGGSEGGELKVWDVLRGKRIRTLAGHPGIVHSVAWGISEEIVVIGDCSGKLRWWDLQSGECLREQEAHQGRVQSLRRSPEGTRLASCGGDGAVLLWDLATGENLQSLRQDRPYERLNIHGILGLSEAQKKNLRTLGAVEQPNKGK